jgi:hypothetical protein
MNEWLNINFDYKCRLCATEHINQASVSMSNNVVMKIDTDTE